MNTTKLAPSASHVQTLFRGTVLPLRRKAPASESVSDDAKNPASAADQSRRREIVGPDGEPDETRRRECFHQRHPEIRNPEADDWMTRHDLLEFTAGGVAFCYAERVYWWITARYIHWKLERDFRASEARMRGCPHAETAVIDTGMGLDGNSRKCKACWAICICGTWSPNSAPWSSYDADGRPLYAPHEGGGPRVP